MSRYSSPQPSQQCSTHSGSAHPIAACLLGDAARPCPMEAIDILDRTCIRVHGWPVIDSVRRSFWILFRAYIVFAASLPRNSFTSRFFLITATQTDHQSYGGPTQACFYKHNVQCIRVPCNYMTHMGRQTWYCERWGHHRGRPGAWIGLGNEW